MWCVSGAKLQADAIVFAMRYGATEGHTHPALFCLDDELKITGLAGLHAGWRNKQDKSTVQADICGFAIKSASICQFDFHNNIEGQAGEFSMVCHGCPERRFKGDSVTQSL